MNVTDAVRLTIRTTKIRMEDGHATATIIAKGLCNNDANTSEYLLADRLDTMRKIAFALAERLREEGYGVSESTYKEIDVEIETKTFTRFTNF